MAGFSETQLEQLRVLSYEEREYFNKRLTEEREAILAYIDERFVAERQYTRDIMRDSEERLTLEIRDANIQRREDDDLILARVRALEEPVGVLAAARP